MPSSSCAIVGRAPDLALSAADDAGYVFAKSRNRALRNVSAWPAERLKKAAIYYEGQVND